MSTETDFTAEELGSLATELRTMWHALVSGMNQPGRVDSLQRQQFWVLGALAHGPHRMGELAERAGTSQASLTGIVDRLEERGLIERTRSLDDRRVVEVNLTESGREEIKIAPQGMLHRLEEVLTPLSLDDRRELSRLIGEINLHARPDDDSPRCCR